jgi:hypothetical protein
MRRSSFSFRDPTKLWALNMSDESFRNPKLFWELPPIILGELAYESCFDVSLHLTQEKMVIFIHSRILVYGRQRDVRQRTLPSMMTGDLAMLILEINILDKAWSNFRRVNLALAYFRKGSKSLLTIVTCMMEEHLLVLVLSSCQLVHTRLKAFNLLHELHLSYFQLNNLFLMKVV